MRTDGLVWAVALSLTVAGQASALKVAYAAWTDVVHFRASDGSDPRSNGRRYTILVPPPVVHLENLTLDEILTRDL